MKVSLPFWPGIFFIAIPLLGYLLWGDKKPDRKPVARVLKTLATAQWDLRDYDRDGDGVRSFWRADVAGLYGRVSKDGSAPMKLIELSTAAADARPVTDLRGVATREPRNGFWYRAIRNADENPAKLDPHRFAFCAYPEDADSHAVMFIINEGNTVFQAPAVKGGIETFPDLETLKAQWSKPN